MTEDQAEVDQLCLEDMAEFCLATGVSPESYWNMTQNEVDAFITVHNRNQKSKGA